MGMESAAESSAATTAKQDGHNVRRFHRDILCCFLCRGFLIDATTITECMHTFCKSCLLQRLESIPSCPTCGVQLQRSRLGEQLRLDHLVQNIVYKCLPGLWHEEQRRRKHFSDTHPLGNTSLASVVPTLVPPLYFSPEDSISLSIDYIPPEDNRETQPPIQTKLPDVSSRRYFRCPAAVTVHSFQRLLSLKFDLEPDLKVEILYEKEKLKSQYRLMDIAYIYGWTQDEPLRLQFRLCQSRSSTAAKCQPSSTNTVPVPLPSVPTSSATHQSRPVRGTKLPSQQPPAARSSKREREKLSPVRSLSPPVLKKSRPEKRAESNPVTTKRSSAVTPKPTGRGQWRKAKTSETKVRGSVYQAVHQMLKKKLPVLLSTPSVAKEPDMNQRKESTPVETTEPPTPSWENPTNGVELLVKAAELASQQCPTPPPSSSSESESIHSTPSCPAGTLEKPSSPNGSLVIVEEDEPEEREDRPEERVESPQCSSETALDLSSKSTRMHPDASGPPTNKSKPSLHSITESLAHRQQQLLEAKQQPPDAMRNLLTLSQTAALVASTRPKSVAQPVNSERAAAQRLLAAMQRTFASFSTPPLPARVASGARSKTSSSLNVVQKPS